MTLSAGLAWRAMTSANCREERKGPKRTSASCAATKKSPVAQAADQVEAEFLPRARSQRATRGPARKASAASVAGRRRPANESVVRSKKWDIESVYPPT